MAQHLGFVDQPRPQHVCKLRKSLYGLNQSPCMWHEKLTGVLLTYNFRGCHADVSLYLMQRETIVSFCLIYVMTC